MAIWDFNDYEDRDLLEIYSSADNLNTYGLVNEDMFNELYREIEKRGLEEQI